jgi:FkbM family methyltransferase
MEYPVCWQVASVAADHTRRERDATVAALGHEPEIKSPMPTCFGSAAAPSCFSLSAPIMACIFSLWLAHGVRTVSFEPTARCHAYVRRASKLNGLTCNIESVAVSDRECTATLWFPEREDWLGSIDASLHESLARTFSLCSAEVGQTTIDTYVSGHGCSPELIKIDTEGNELRVLRGSRETLRSCRPLVIFESRPGERQDYNGVLARAALLHRNSTNSPEASTGSFDGRLLPSVCGQQLYRFRPRADAGCRLTAVN